MKLGKIVIYKGKEYELKAEVRENGEITYLLGGEDWPISRWIKAKRKDIS